MSRSKMTLCAARFNFQHDGEWCANRCNCERYQRFINWPEGEPVSVRVTMGRPDCPDHIDTKPEPEQKYLIVTRSKHGVCRARRSIYYSESLAHTALEFVSAHEKKVITINLEDEK